MSHEIVAEKRVIIVNPQGLHLRPADLFARMANNFQSQIDLVKDDQRVDGKSILGIVTLMATQGTELAIQAKGPDANDALQALVNLVEQGFLEMDDDTSCDVSAEATVIEPVGDAESSRSRLGGSGSR